MLNSAEHEMYPAKRHYFLLFINQIDNAPESFKARTIFICQHFSFMTT